MYKIANDKHPSPQSINRKITRCVTIVINRAMEKDLTKRYERGKNMATDISKCLKIIAAEKKAIKNKPLKNKLTENKPASKKSAAGNS
jgi:serine/threonine-protein kinase